MSTNIFSNTPVVNPRESCYMGDPWSDQVSFTFDDYEYIEQSIPDFGYDNPSQLTGTDSTHDSVNRPKHYTQHPSGVECIQVTEHYNFCVGNAIKYLWRAGLKGDSMDPKQKQIEDLKKAIWYIQREIENLELGKYE